MSKKTTVNYKFNAFSQGSAYSSVSDYRRFVTLDNNFESYIGIIGNGIVSGWKITSSGLTIQILPGKGIINGYAVESPYYYRQRSEMVIGDREVEEIHDTDTIYPDLTGTARSTYISVIQAYDPTYDPLPTESIENCFVKVVVPAETAIVIPDDSERSIYAERSNTATPYPLVNDYPVSTLPQPNAGDFSTNAEYLAQLAIYDFQLQQIRDYRWRANVANHYTAVTFKSATSFSKTKNRVLIGRVVSKNGVIEKVDTSKNENLQGMLSAIQKYVSQIIPSHQHGGSSYFDPPQIKLQTDIRKAVVKKYNSTTKVTDLNILSSSKTSLMDGHRHDFYLDSSNNGITISLYGTEFNHYHNISDSVLGDSIYTNISEQGVSHIHELPSVSSMTGWDASSSFAVYINGEFFADQSSSSVLADPLNNMLYLYNAVGTSYRQYGCTFTDPTGAPYSFTDNSSSVLQFMLKMEIDYFSKFGSYIGGPFTFQGDTVDSIAGLTDLYNQSMVAQNALRYEGDSFTFVPKAALNITIVLLTAAQDGIESYNVKIEILGNSEVSGKLQSENIVYVDASKFKTGTFDIKRLPFVSHIGRMRESLSPSKYSMISKNGMQYFVSPSSTTQNTDHYHELFLNFDNSGVTQQTMIGLDQVYYATGSLGQSFLIDHTHGITQSNVSSVTTSGLDAWQKNVNNVNSATHTHNVIYPSKNDVKTVYSIRHLKDGSILAGTSYGLIVMPNSKTYLFVINEEPIYVVGNDLWTSLNNAGAIYQQKTGKTITITSELYYTQVQEGELKLNSNGDSIILLGNTDPSRDSDSIMIKLLYYYQVPNFQYSSNKYFYALEDGDKITGVVYFDSSTGLEVSLDELNAMNSDQKEKIEFMAVVQQNLNDNPFLNIESYSFGDDNENEKIIAVNPQVVTQNDNIISNFYNDWKAQIAPSNSGSFKKVIVDSNKNIWAITNNGIIISRSVFEECTFNSVTHPGLKPNIYDIIEGESGKIYCTTEDGIYKTENGGSLWTKVFSSDNGIVKIIKDKKMDVTDVVNGHYHDLNLNIEGTGITGVSTGGILHTHTVRSLVVEEIRTPGNIHTHSIISKMYALDSMGKIYLSNDSGETWEYLVTIDTVNNGIFAHEHLFYAKENGLYKLNSLLWEMVFDKTVFSFSPLYDLSGFLIGCHNEIYESIDGITYTNVIELDGKAQSVFYKNDQREIFGNLYSGINNSFTFQEMLYSKTPCYALVDFSRWYAENGIWNSNSNTDIFIDRKLVYSTKNNIDRRLEYGYYFTINPTEGNIDFGFSTQLSLPSNVYSNYVTVDDASGFIVGDRVNILWNGELKKPNTTESLTIENVEKQYGSNSDNAIYTSDLIKYENMNVFTEIESISGNDLYLKERLDKDFEIPSKVCKIPNVDGSTEININIYESKLGDIGTFTHEELEDGLSYLSDGRPYNFNNTYLSNLLQLTQAVKYAVPTIDYSFKNANFYDFHHTEDYIDFLSCEMNNYCLFKDTFYNMGAKKINRILIGTGIFNEYVFVGTDIGMFWCKNSDSLEGNWFYVADPQLKTSIYDLRIFGDKLFICTVDGTYYSKDIITFVLITEQAVFYPSTVTGFRWGGGETVFIPSHSATIQNSYSLEANVGTITTSSEIYSSLNINHKIEIKSEDYPSVDGIYTIKTIENNSYITTFETFPIETSQIVSPITIRMGAWWEYLQGETSTHNPMISNTLLVGGSNKISYCTNSEIFDWNESYIPTNVNNFNVSGFCPLTNGSVIASTISTKTSEVKNSILYSNDSSSTWSEFIGFEEINGSISNVTLTKYGHSKIKITYSGTMKRKYKNGDLANKSIMVFSVTRDAPIYHGNVVWNENDDNGGSDSIVIYGSSLYDLSKYGVGSWGFVTYPLKINSIIEQPDTTVLFATDNGIFNDNKTIINKSSSSGAIISSGYEVIVNSIDTTGTIKNIVKTPSSTGLITVVLNSPCSSNELQGRTIYIVDTAAAENYEILSNTGTNIKGEVSIEIVLYSAKFSLYKGKKVTIPYNGFSRVYVSLNNTVKDGQFNGGEMIVSSGDSFGSRYHILQNNKEYIDVTPQIVPTSTFAGSNVGSGMASGQSVKLMDAAKAIKLYVTYDEPVEENSLAGSTFEISTFGSPLNNGVAKIYSNDFNSITLYPIEDLVIESSSVTNNTAIPKQTVPAILLFQAGTTYFTSGFIMSALLSFNNKVTSNEIDHTHEVSLIDKKLTGTIVSFSNVSDSFVDMLVSDTNGFDDTFIQSNGNLLNGARISFYNNSGNYWLSSTVISHTSTTIRANIKNTDMWDFISYNSGKISTSWKWQIDSENFGYTNNIYYHDFSTLTTNVISNIDIGSSEIRVKSTSGISIGDKIRIFSYDKSEVNYVANIVDSNVLETEFTVQKYYDMKNTPNIEVLKDSFTNNHTHQISKNQIETLYINDYLLLGYNSLHSHKIQALIQNVTKILEKNDGNIENIAIGSSENVFASYNGEWSSLINLNNIQEGVDNNINTIEEVSDIVINSNNKIVLGSSSGYVVTQATSDSIIPLEKPVI